VSSAEQDKVGGHTLVLSVQDGSPRHMEEDGTASAEGCLQRQLLIIRGRHGGMRDIDEVEYSFCLAVARITLVVIVDLSCSS
jgi:hypothetical protein